MAKKKKRNRKPPNNAFLSRVVSALARDGFEDVVAGSVKVVVPRQGVGYTRWHGLLCDHCHTRFEGVRALIFLKRKSTSRFEVCTDRPACRERRVQHLVEKAAGTHVSQRQNELKLLKQRVML